VKLCAAARTTRQARPSRSDSGIEFIVAARRSSVNRVIHRLHRLVDWYGNHPRSSYKLSLIAP